MNIRKDATNLNTAERKALFDALIILKKNGVYDHYVQLHSDSMMQVRAFASDPLRLSATLVFLITVIAGCRSLFLLNRAQRPEHRQETYPKGSFGCAGVDLLRTLNMSGDVPISGDYPALQFDATESGSTYFEDREINGVMYRAQNASFNTMTLVWSSKNNAKPSYALTQNADGSIGHLTKAPTLSPWTTWSGSVQRSSDEEQKVSPKW